MTTLPLSSFLGTNFSGYTGSQGAGFTGSQGIIGFTGSQGDLGYTGSQGVGFTGSQGTIGFTGSQGVGFTGSQGVGFTGSQGNIGFTGSQGATGTIPTTFTNDITFSGAVAEAVYNLTVQGTTPILNPSNGTIQLWTLSGASAPTDSILEGEYITLMIDDGAAYTITWPTITWVNNKKVAPTLAATGYTVVSLWKVNTVLYGALVGDGT